jgi:hypothetical protein
MSQEEKHASYCGWGCTLEVDTGRNENKYQAVGTDFRLFGKNAEKS